MHENIERSAVCSDNLRGGDHLIQTLIKKENLNVVSADTGMEVRPNQLLIADCRIATPQQIQDWYVAKPADTPFLVLSPEKEHLAEMAKVCKLTVTEKQYAVLYQPAMDDRICVTALSYMLSGKDKKPDAVIEPTANSKSTDYFMEAVRRSLEGLIKLDITYPADPPKGMIWTTPGQIISSTSELFETYREDDGTAVNKSDTSFVSTYTPYLFLQQQSNGTVNNQVLIIATEWNIISGELYADDKHDRGNALCNMTGTLQPEADPSLFFASDPPNDFSPKSGSGSFDASIKEPIYYYDYDSGETLSYTFLASATYDIKDWSVASNCSGTALGPNFYATQPTSCKSYPSGSQGFYDNHSKIHDLTPASSSNGILNFGTFCSWQTKPNVLASGLVTINANWTATVYRWYVDHGFWGNKDYLYSSQYRPLNQPFSVDFTGIQPSG